MNLNKVLLIGNLTKDPETRTTTTGQTVTTFSLATNRVWNDQQGQKQQKVEFHNIVAWGKLGEICAQYLRKGGLLYAEGRLETRSWEGQDGIKRYKTEIVLENMQMGPKSQNVGGMSPAPSKPQNEAPEINEDEITVDDIPF